MAWRISLRPVRIRAEEMGIDNPYLLSGKAGIAYNTAKRYWYDREDLRCIDKDVLISLSLLLRCQPGDLMEMINEAEHNNY